MTEKTVHGHIYADVHDSTESKVQQANNHAFFLFGNQVTWIRSILCVVLQHMLAGPDSESYSPRHRAIPVNRTRLVYGHYLQGCNVLPKAVVYARLRSSLVWGHYLQRPFFDRLARSKLTFQRPERVVYASSPCPTPYNRNHQSVQTR